MTEESKKAVALRYEQKKDSAPKVVAKGRGLARGYELLNLQDNNGVPLKEDKTLVEVLSKLELSEEIPVELYKAVAEILVFVYQIKEKIK